MDSPCSAVKTHAPADLRFMLDNLLHWSGMSLAGRKRQRFHRRALTLPISYMASFTRSMPTSSMASFASSVPASLTASFTRSPPSSSMASSRARQYRAECYRIAGHLAISRDAGLTVPLARGRRLGRTSGQALARPQRSHTSRDCRLHDIVEQCHCFPRRFVPRTSQSSPSGRATTARHCQGAQERLVPTTKGSIPEAPDGGHSSQVGTLLDVVPVALPGDPAELAGEAAREALGRDVLDRGVLDSVLAFPAPDAAPVAVPGVGPKAVPVVPVVVADVD